MKDKQIYITKPDFDRLTEITKNIRSRQEIDRRSLDELEHSFSSRDELGLIKEVRKIKSSRNDTEWARIEELEAEFGSDLLQQARHMVRVHNADHSSAVAALNEAVGVVGPLDVARHL